MPGEQARGPGKVPVRLRVNGKVYHVYIEPRRTLLDALRTDLNLTGAKKGCDMGQCGACTVMLDGRAVYSCLILAIECEGREILTIEGLSDGTRLHPVQQSFVEHDAYQCGFCTPGQVISVHALLEQKPDATPDEIRHALSGNLCRCGAYHNILAAAENAQERLKRDGKRSEKE